MYVHVMTNIYFMIKPYFGLADTRMLLLSYINAFIELDKFYTLCILVDTGLCKHNYIFDVHHREHIKRIIAQSGTIIISNSCNHNLTVIFVVWLHHIYDYRYIMIIKLESIHYSYG